MIRTHIRCSSEWGSGCRELQDFFDGSVSLTERHVPAVISLPVANMNVHDAVMMFANKIDRVVVARSKVADV